MKLLLIWPYNQHAIDIPETFPLGIGYLAANIPTDRHEVEVLDATLDRLHPRSEAFLDRLRASRADVVGISFWSANAESVYATRDAVRDALPGARVLFGGPHATGYGRAEIERGEADYVIAGEGERAVPALLDSLEAGTDPADAHIPGLVCRDRDGGVVQRPVCYETDLDTLGRVDYGELRLPEYQANGYGYKGKAVLHPDLPSALLLATRGCPFRCRFCNAPVISGRRIRVHSPGYVARTIRELYEVFGVRIVALGDDNFTFRPDYAVALCQAVEDLGFDDLILVAPNGVRMNRMTDEVLGAMVRAGFEEVTIAPESGSPRTLKLMQKDMDLGTVAPFVDRCHRFGLKVKANFIIGFPGETMEDVLRTERFIRENAFDQISLCFFQPLPGTPMFDELVAAGEIPPYFVPGRYSQLTYTPAGMDTHELCNVFNRIMNDFRDAKGWKYKNSRVGTIRDAA